MHHQQSQSNSQKINAYPCSSGIATNNSHVSGLVQTLEHRRFAEFCDGCRKYGYIGLCYGPPGVGKTLSSRHYSHWDSISTIGRWTNEYLDVDLSTLFYTPSVVNSPGKIEADIRHARDRLTVLARRPLQLEAQAKLESVRQRDKEHDARAFLDHDWLTDGPIPQPQPTYGEVAEEYGRKELQIGDPTTLIVIDEADRLRMASLEQVRAIFDAGEIGLILVGMPGLEKRLARDPQFYSRIGFVHEFRPLGAAEVRQLLEQHWTPPRVNLPDKLLKPETIAVIIRITGGNFRLLNRLLTQVERILEINLLDEVTHAVVEAARESLVIGQT